MRSLCLFLLVTFVLVGCQDKKTNLIQKPAVDPPNAVEPPSVGGKIMILGDWKDESLTVGFVGKGRDRKALSNSCGLTFTSIGAGESITSETFKPQLTS